MDSNNKQKVVVVEGYHDLAVLKRIFPDIDIVITNGSEISEETLNELAILHKTRGLILFLDPDFQGERIRNIINTHVGETSHAFLPKEKCISKNKKKVGIEHAKDEDIIEALSQLKHSSKYTDSDITMKDLYELHLVGTKDAKEKRKRISDKTGIGLANGKTLLKKLHMFGIKKTDLIKHLKE